MTKINVLKLNITLVILLICTSCVQKTQNLSNNSLIEKIDKINKEVIVYVIKTDSINNPIDTLNIISYKKNDKNIKVFEKKIIFTDRGTITVNNYYRDNEELFFSDVYTSKNGHLSRYETWVEKGLVNKAVSIEYENEYAIDTIFIKYKQDFIETKLHKTLISNIYKGKVGNVTELYYNSNEDVTKAVFKQKKDTLKVINTYYNQNKMAKKIIKVYKDSIYIKFLYDNNGYIKLKEVFRTEQDSLIKLSQVEYDTDELGEITKSKESFVQSKKKTYLTYKSNSN